jgi:acetylornithine deacetylase/succinyl-diaminopimelate desuccinylase-like protein
MNKRTLVLSTLDVLPAALSSFWYILIAMRKPSSILVFIALALSTVSAQITTSIRQYRQTNEHRLFNEFIELLKIPNVASDTPNIRRNADHLVAEMQKRGLKPRLLEAADKKVPPVVYGEWMTPGATKTVIFYAHYDGQPTDPKDWTGSEPWKPVVRTNAFEKGGQTIPFPKAGEKIDPEWRIYARSASDDKAGVFAILTAFDAIVAQKIKPTVNIKFFFEGEEEDGSPNLREILTKNKDLLKADAFIVCDGPVHQSGRKQVVFGVRGVTGVDITVYGASRPLHSGHYGNWSPNPANTLARLLASMKDDKGNIVVKGWGDDVEPLGQIELQAIKDAPAYDEEIKRQLGIAYTEGGGKSLLELIHLPSLNIAGIKSGDVGTLARNVIPSSANVVMDLRLVKGNDHVRQVEKLRKHIESQGFYVIDRDPTEAERLAHPFIAKFVHKAGGYNAQRTRMDLPISLAVIDAVQASSSEPIVRMPTLGGSLPLSIISETLGQPTITVPIANYDNNQHAENENIRIQNLWDGIEIFANLMRLRFE